MKQSQYKKYIENCMRYYSCAMTAVSLIDEFIDNNDLEELYQYEDCCYGVNDEGYDYYLESKLEEYRALIGNAGWVAPYIMYEAEALFEYIKSKPKHCLNLQCFQERIAVCTMLCYAYLDIYDGYPDISNYWDIDSADYGLRSIPKILQQMLKDANVKSDIVTLCSAVLERY